MKQEFMQPMDARGGNAPADGGITAAGVDAWVRSKPTGSAEGGHNVYYLSGCATGRIARLFLGNVVGDADAVTDAAAGLRALVRRHANRIDQSRLVRAVNEHFANRRGDGAFVTALVATYFAPTGHLSLCNAGHPPPLLYRAAEREWVYLDQRAAAGDAFASVPPGVVDLVNYDEFDVRLEAGDLVLCFTDVLLASRDAAGEALGLAGLLEIARSLDVTDAAGVVPQLAAAVRRRCGQEESDDVGEDDLTIVLLRPNGSGARVALRDRVLGPARMMRDFLASLGGGEPMAWPEVSLPSIGGIFLGSLNRLWSRQRAAHVLAAPLQAALPDPRTRRIAPSRVRAMPARATPAAPVASDLVTPATPQPPAAVESATVAPAEVNSAA